MIGLYWNIPFKGFTRLHKLLISLLWCIMRPSRLLLAVILCAAWCFNTSIAQQPTKPAAAGFPRVVTIDEFTGTWCGFCPYGAWILDTMRSRMGASLVVNSFHNSASDVMALVKVEDSLAKDRQVTGYPNGSVDGGVAQGVPAGWNETQVAWYLQARNDSSKLTHFDFKIVNISYDDLSKTVQFDLEITPYMLGTIPELPKEGPENMYYTRALLTEDEVVASNNPQHLYHPDGSDAGTMSDFVHQDVVRKVAGKVKGDAFTLGSATTYPIRRHYSMKVSDSWNIEKLRIKAEMGVRSPKANVVGAYVFNAAGSDYLSNYTSDAKKELRVVLPHKGDVWSADSINQIVWSMAGATGAVKIEYSVVGSGQWSAVTPSTTNSPFTWTIPADAYDMNVQVRVTDVATSALVGTSDPFFILKPTPASISINEPYGGQVFRPGDKLAFKYTTSGPVDKKINLEFSGDDGKTWAFVADISASTTYNWTVKDTLTTTARLRAVDGKGIIGTSPRFTISQKTGTLSAITVEGAVNNKITAGEPFTLKWTWDGGAASNELHVETSVIPDKWVERAKLVEGETSYTTTINSQVKIKFRLRYNDGVQDITRETPQLEIVPLDAVRISGVATTFALEQNYPNPFNPTTTIRYSVPTNTEVYFTVHDMMGREVLRTTSAQHSAGVYEEKLDCSSLASGTYVYKLHAGEHTMQGTMVLSK